MVSIIALAALYGITARPWKSHISHHSLSPCDYCGIHTISFPFFKPSNHPSNKLVALEHSARLSPVRPVRSTY